MPAPQLKPSVEEIAEYCRSRNSGIDPEAFFDYYETNGWVQGKCRKPIKSWQAAVRTWERNKKQTAVATQQQFIEKHTSRDWAN